MSESGFYLLPTNKLYKKENTRQLKKFPAGYVGGFYRNLADNVGNTSDSFFENNCRCQYSERSCPKIYIGNV